MGNGCSCFENQANGHSTLYLQEDKPDIDDKSQVELNRHYVKAISLQKEGPYEECGPTNEKQIKDSKLREQGNQDLEKEMQEKQKEKEQQMEIQKILLKQKIWRYILGHLFRTKYKKSLKKELEIYRDKLYELWINITQHTSVRKIESNSKTPPYDPMGWKLYNNKNDFQPSFTGKLFDNTLIFTYVTDKRNDFTSVTQLVEIASSAYRGQVTIDMLRQGYGTLIEKSGAKYIGYWDNNHFTGWGRYINDKGILYQGTFLDGLLNGKGCEISIEGYSYFGDFAKGQRHGEGTEETTEMTYKGSFINDKRHGKGEMILKNGDTYIGMFENHLFHGNGVYKWKENGHVYDGQYVRGNIHGFGTYTWNNYEYYEGEYVNGIKEGNGEFMWENGTKYVGPFKSGLPHGIGYIEKNGRKNEVEFLEGKINKNYRSKNGLELSSCKIKEE